MSDNSSDEALVNDDEALHISVDDGSPRALREPNRQCAVTRQVLPKSELIRFVADPGGRIVVDLKSVLPGRGVWVALNKQIVEQAEKRKIFIRLLSKSSEQPISVDAELAEHVEKLLSDRAVGALALAQKAGRIITGFSKVEAAIGGDKLVALIAARDGADDSLRKLRQAVTRRWGLADVLPLFRDFDGEELDLAFGRTNVIHAALTKAEKASKRGDGGFLKAAERLHTYVGARAEPDASSRISKAR